MRKTVFVNSVKRCKMITKVHKIFPSVKKAYEYYGTRNLNYTLIINDVVKTEMLNH